MTTPQVAVLLTICCARAWSPLPARCVRARRAHLITRRMPRGPCSQTLHGPVLARCGLTAVLRARILPRATASGSAKTP